MAVVEQIGWSSADLALTARRVLDHPAAHSARRAAWVSSALLAVPLAAHAYVGWFTRFVVDDFCMATAYRSYGLLGSVGWWYRNWSGRWAHFLTVNLAEAAGRWSLRVIPALLIVLWVAAMTWAFVQAGRRIGIARPLAGAVLGAEAIAVATLVGVRDQFLSVYWRPGVIAYLMPWILLSVAAGLVVRAGAGGARRGAVIVPGLLAYLAGGFTETQTAVQIAVLGILVVCSIRFFSRRTRLALLGMLLMSIAAMAALAVAPGNDVRMGMLGGVRSPAETIRAAATATSGFAAESFRLAPAGLAIAGLAGLALGYVCVPRRRGPFFLIPVATAAVIFASMLPSAYTGYVYPTPRVLVIPQAVLAAGLALMGFFAGGAIAASTMRIEGRRLAAAGLAVLGATFVPASISSTLARADVARAYSQNVDARDATLRQLRGQNVRAVSLDILPAGQRRWVGGLDLTWERNSLINACIAEYYGFDSVIARIP